MTIYITFFIGKSDLVSFFSTYIQEKCLILAQILQFYDMICEI